LATGACELLRPQCGQNLWGTQEKKNLHKRQKGKEKKVTRGSMKKKKKAYPKGKGPSF